MNASQEAAFGAFVAESGVALLVAARRLVGDTHEAEDLLQVALTRTAAAWSRVGNPVAYARSALVSLACDRARRAHLVPRPVEDADLGAGHAAAREVAASDRLEQRESLEEWLAVLTPAQRVAVVLHVLEDLPVAEVARLTGDPVATVKSRLARGMATLRTRALVDERGTREGAR